MRIAFSPNLSLMRRAEFLPRSSQMRDLPAVRAAHLRTFRCCGMTDVEGGEPTVILRHCIRSILRKRSFCMPPLLKI